MLTKFSLFRLVVVSLGVLVVVSLSVPSAISGNANIPSNLLNYRDRLLQLRDRYLGEENEQNRCLSEDETIIRQVDKILTSNPINRQALLSVRYEHLRCIDKHGTYLGALNTSITKIDSELSRVESDIRSFACMR